MNDESFINPGGYWCPPNGATPEYIPAQDIGEFIAYGLLVCWIDPEHTVCKVTPGNVCDLREGFLNCLEDAVRFWRDQEVGRDTGCDPAQPTVSFDLPDGESCETGWCFERVDNDALLFVMFWTGADDLAIWLAREAIEGKEQEALAALQAARRLLDGKQARLLGGGFRAR